MNKLYRVLKNKCCVMKVVGPAVLWCVSASTAWAGIYMGTEIMAPIQYIPAPLPDAIMAAAYQRAPGRHPLEPSTCEIHTPYYEPVDKFGYPTAHTLPTDYIVSPEYRYRSN
ncbi:MAG: hypothetical protein ACX932_01920 [Gammaproteobacteria bacterium]